MNWFLERLKSHEALWAKTNWLMEVSALSGLDSRAGQECSGWGVPADGGVVVPRAREQVVLVGLGDARSPPTCGCKAVPSSSPALMTQFPAGRESAPEILCAQSPALCPRAAVTEQACSPGRSRSHEPSMWKPSNMKRSHAGLWLVSPAFELVTYPPRTCSERLLCVARTSAAHIRA